MSYRINEDVCNVPYLMAAEARGDKRPKIVGIEIQTRGLPAGTCLSRHDSDVRHMSEQTRQRR